MGKISSIIVVISIYMYSFTVYSQAILLEENGSTKGHNTTSVSGGSENSFDFKYLRKVGVGLGIAGAHGLAGLTIELNFSPETSFSTNFGLASNFQTFGVVIKRSVGGKYFSPYIAGGFSRWYTVVENGPINSSSPSFLAEKFLTTKERQEGNFSETLLYPALGIQYLQLNGEWQGASLYAEVIMLIDLDDFQSAPTGGVGFLYYF